MFAGDAEHRILRRVIGPAFSQRAIQQQEEYLTQYVQLFIRVLRREAESSKHGIVNLTKWLTFLSVDFIGELVFGESFRGLETGVLHPFLALVFYSFKSASFMRELNRYPRFLLKAMFASMPKKLMEQRMEVMKWAPEAVQRRVELGTDRSDIMSYVLEHKDEYVS